MSVLRAFKAGPSFTGPVLRPHVRPRAKITGAGAPASAPSSQPGRLVAIARASDPDVVATAPAAAGFYAAQEAHRAQGGRLTCRVGVPVRWP
jgi:hypothetical protein